MGWCVCCRRDAPADAHATKDDDDDKDKSLLIGIMHDQEATCTMNWPWLAPRMVAFESLPTTIRNSTVKANERKVVASAGMIMGSAGKILRMLVGAFMAAIANGQRHGTPAAEYEQTTKQHYTGEGSGVRASIMRLKTAPNPLMHVTMQDMFRSVLEGSKPAHTFNTRRRRQSRWATADARRSNSSNRRQRHRRRNSMPVFNFA